MQNHYICPCLSVARRQAISTHPLSTAANTLERRVAYVTWAVESSTRLSKASGAPGLGPTDALAFPT